MLDRDWTICLRPYGLEIVKTFLRGMALRLRSIDATNIGKRSSFSSFRRREEEDECFEASLDCSHNRTRAQKIKRKRKERRVNVSFPDNYRDIEH